MRVLNKYHAPHGDTLPIVNIMRGGALGNLFKIGADGNRAQVVKMHDEYIRQRVKTDERFRKLVYDLDGHDLECCCAPRACHGDNLKRLCEELHLAS
jgi:hypothetical protein